MAKNADILKVYVRLLLSERDEFFTGKMTQRAQKENRRETPRCKENILPRWGSLYSTFTHTIKIVKYIFTLLLQTRAVDIFGA